MPIAKRLATTLKNSMDKLTPVTKKDELGTVVLAEDYPNEVEKSVANFRFIYNNDATVRGLLFNNAITAINGFHIKIKEGYEDKPNIEEAYAHIMERSRKNDWNLKEVIKQTLIKAQRDRQCFIQIPIIENQAHLNPLTYDGENYDFMLVPDVENGKILGYVQKHPTIPDFSKWENMEWDELVELAEDEGDDPETTSFLEEEIIHFAIIKEDGEGEGMMEAIPDQIKRKWDYEGYMISVSQKTGALAIVKVGDERHEVGDINTGFVQNILDVLKGRIRKTAVAVPDGVSVEQMGNNQLPNIPDYRRTVLMEIYITLQTPRSMFNTKESSYASSEVATDFETGYGVFLADLRDSVKDYFEEKLFDTEISLTSAWSECVGGIEIGFVHDNKDLDEVKPLEPNADDLSADNPDLDKAAQQQESNNNDNNTGDEGGEE